MDCRVEAGGGHPPGRRKSKDGLAVIDPWERSLRGWRCEAVRHTSGKAMTMTVRQIRTIVAAAALAAGVTIAEAHHGGAVEFDASKTDGPFVGTVTRVALSYPHPQIYFDVKRDDG